VAGEFIPGPTSSNEVAKNGSTGQPRMLAKTQPISVEWLNRRLMTAVCHSDLRRVKVFLALGADPNLAFPSVTDGLPIPDILALSVTFPLALAMEFSGLEFDNFIVKALLAAGADVALCLYWFSRTASPDLPQIVYGLILCEIIRKLPGQPVYKQTITTWLTVVSTKLNKLPEPADMDRRDYHILVHKLLLKVSNDFGWQHEPVAWVTAGLL
jgi:hypothetical protein